MKIADFGIAELLMDEDDEMKIKAGTRAFMAPETFQVGIYNAKLTDIWAVGATLYYMILGKVPFPGKNYYELKKSISNNEPEFPEDMDPLC